MSVSERTVSGNKKKADIVVYETDLGDYYSVNLKDESGTVVSIHAMDNVNEAKRMKDNWENGNFEHLVES